MISSRAVSRVIRQRAPLMPLMASVSQLRPTVACRCIHLSCTNSKERRKKWKQVEVVGLKKTKSTKEITDFYDRMRISEVASALGESVESVTDTLLEFDEDNIKLLEHGELLDRVLLGKIAASYGRSPRFTSRPRDEVEEEVDVFPQPPPPTSECKRRAPVVTIMGHVDHGKTTLLDSLRNSRIAAQEHGGITQHIGAFSVSLPKTKAKVTFIDTPGHAAFAAMRQRGARSTDIVVLVVAADDGVKDQTVESIKYARDAGVPIVVAINKCDKPTADPAKARRDLLEHGVVVEDMAGDAQVVEISALHGKNLDALQEALVVQAEMMDLKSTWNGLVEGIVIESTSAQGLGKVCTVIVQRGTLRRGAVLVAGTAWAKVRNITDEFGKSVKEAGPSSPVRIAGWRDDQLPPPGERILEVKDEGRAQKVAEYRAKKNAEKKFESVYEEIEQRQQDEREVYLDRKRILRERGKHGGSTLRMIAHREQRFRADDGKEGEDRQLRIMLRTDVDGTLEAILNVLETYQCDDVDLQIVDFDVGPPNENHVDVAEETGALIYCFNVPISANIRKLAHEKNVAVEQFNVIYKLIADLKQRLSAKIPQEIELKQVGEGHVLKEFMISGIGNKRHPVAGTLVDWGFLKKTCKFRVMRGSKMVYEGPIESMKREKEVVSTATTNTEVGIALGQKDVRFEPDDIVEAYEELVVRRTIAWDPPGF